MFGGNNFRLDNVQALDSIQKPLILGGFCIYDSLLLHSSNKMNGASPMSPNQGTAFAGFKKAVIV